MTDQQLIKLSNEIDNTLHNIMEKYNVHGLSLTGVILARLKIMFDAVGNTDDFNALLNTVAETKQKPREFH